MNTNLVENINYSAKSITKLIILQMKSIFTNPLLLFMIFLLPIILLFGIGVMIEEVQVFAASFGLIEGLIIGIIYGHIHYSIDKTTIGENMSLTKTKQHELFTSGAITIFIIALSVFLIQLSIMMIFESLTLIFQFQYAGALGEAQTPFEARDIIWSKVSYGAVLIFFLQTYLLNLSIYFVTGQIFSQLRTFSIFVLIMFLLVLLFGGVVNDTWGYYNPNTKELVPWGSIDKAILGDGNWDAYNSSYTTFQEKSWYSYMPFVVPQYFNNQHFFYVLAPGSRFVENVSNVVGQGKSFPPHFNFMYWSKYDQWWNFTLLAPYAYSIGLFIIGFLIKRAKTIV